MRGLHRSTQSCLTRPSVHVLVEDAFLSSATTSARCLFAQLQNHRNSLSIKGLLKKEQVQRCTRAGSGGLRRADYMAAGSPVLTNILPAQDDHIEAASKALKEGLVVAVPTDTLYGLAADAGSASAIRRLYEIKARQASNPIAICVADIPDVQRYASTDHLPTGLLEALLPGPVTLVLNRLSGGPLSDDLNPGVPGIGVRIPDAHFIRSLARHFGGALALTSANVSNATSTVAVDEFRELWPACAHVFDGGRLQGSREGSTVVDLTKPGGYRILRPGSAFKSTTAVLQEKHGLHDSA
ncbi:hypothetical protein KFL_002860190 [Klebsormidium nitens]|uniref:Threonylcarbamoyl-AMP synthase n=1 Tax=Klebsormidium nitens TaxID=105231 RepID=A0A1Y1I611_KLENI|nr:hypothetical protein KFL_002860190 [Klebsormidium nitens]|eukprot:GAQ86395.1 hypothetical protein KFL_002860190 [Klebsormidium nitens]